MLGEARGERGRAGPAAGALNAQADREQPLDDLVVQVAGDPVAVHDDVQFAAGGLAFGVPQGQRGLVGER